MSASPNTLVTAPARPAQTTCTDRIRIESMHRQYVYTDSIRTESIHRQHVTDRIDRQHAQTAFTDRIDRQHAQTASIDSMHRQHP